MFRMWRGKITFGYFIDNLKTDLKLRKNYFIYGTMYSMYKVYAFKSNWRGIFVIILI